MEAAVVAYLLMVKKPLSLPIKKGNVQCQPYL
jgi:hypothetical protein